MGNFNDYIKSTSDNLQKDNYKDKEKLEEKINEYSALSSDELMNEFIKLTIEKKKKGELKKEELDSIKDTIEPYLSIEQKIMLNKLMNMVDNVK